MTREEKRSRVAENLDLRPSTAVVVVEMLEKQKEFLVAIARDEYNRGVADVLEIIDSNLPHGVIWQEDSWQCGWHDGLTKIRGKIEALRGEQE